jgi:hypothetical protein
MTVPSLVGAIATLWVSDPWDWGTDVGTEPVLVQITRLATSESSRQAILVKMDPPRLFKHQEVEYLVGQPRYVDTRMVDDLSAGKLVYCGFSPLTKERVSSADPFDLSWWLGGTGLVGSMKLKPENVARSVDKS